MIEFRPYQNGAISATRSKIAAGVRRVLINAPTGAGKTVVAAGIIQLAVQKGKRVLVLAHRRELIEQTVDKLVDAGVLNFGVIMAGNKLCNAAAPVQVASIQTLIRRELPDADLIVIDECHRAQSRSYLSIIANYPRAVVLGLSATPERTDGKGLDDIFQDMVVVETVPNLIEQGYLIKPICYVGPTGDLTGVKIKRGDYDESQLAEAMDKPTLTGNIVANWMRLANGKKTAVFAASVVHAEHLRDEFIEAGISAAMVTGETPKAQREAIIADWRAGYITVCVNVYVFVEGFDFPELEVCVLARPTQSVSMYLQAVGRVMRPAKGKDTAMVIDHAGCCQLHGQPHLHREWTLEGMAKKRKAKDDEAGNLLVCDACGMAYESEPKLWLEETQPRLRSAFRNNAADLLRGPAKSRAMDACPGCGAASCKVCTSTFEAKTEKRDIDGIAWDNACSCSSCLAVYVDTPHLNTEPSETEIPDTTNDALIAMGDEVPLKVTVLNDYKRLINEAKQAGRKRGWAYWRLREKYDEDVIKDCLPRHTGSWWKAQA